MQPVSQAQGKAKEPASLEESLLILLRGIQNHTASADPAKDHDFRAKIAALEASFKGRENAGKMAEAAVDMLAQYNDEVSQMVVRQRSELVKATAELAAAGKSLALIQGPAERLTSLERQIDAMSSSDDLASLKARLISEVAMARAEALGERQKISGLILGTVTQLEAVPGAVAADVAPSPMRDALTGLPARAIAETELIRAHQETGDCFLALFVVKRLALINAKFGFPRGDQVLLKVVAHLAQSLPDFHSFFRWTPCSFVTMAPPGTTYREVRSKVQVIEVTRITPTLEWEGHNAMVPVALDCRVITVKDFGTIPELFLRLDTFASDV
jgi:GGDEF domain-containing protein